MKAIPEEATALYRLAGQDRLAFDRRAADSEISLRICCFHAQQGAEKVLKAVAVVHGIVFPPTRDLVRLAALLAPVSSDPPVPVEMLRRLNPYAAALRYDDREIHGISLKEDIVSYVRREVRPYVTDAWIDRETLDEPDGGIGKAGCEINFQTARSSSTSRRARCTRLMRNWPAWSSGFSSCCGR